MVLKKAKTTKTAKKEPSSKEPSSKEPSSKEAVKGSWKCAECGTEITELPFKPAQDRPIYCKNCWKKKRDEKFGDRSRGDFQPRPMIQGNWKCSECRADITELPFKPNPDQPIYCRDCWRKQRDARFQR